MFQSSYRNPLSALTPLLALPLMCGVVYISLYVMTVAGTLSVLTGWARAGVLAWMFGYSVDAQGNIVAGVGVGWDGYTDPASGDPTGLPLAGIPPINCLYNDPNYPGHGGIDLPVGAGTPVYTTMAGKVVFAGANGPWGNLVVVESNGIQIYLAHLLAIYVTEGELISFGTQVGEVGSTGNSSGNHLHYGVKKQTPGGGQVWLDPMLFLGGAEYNKVECK